MKYDMTSMLLSRPMGFPIFVHIDRALHPVILDCSGIRVKKPGSFDLQISAKPNLVPLNRSFEFAFDEPAPISATKFFSSLFKKGSVVAGAADKLNRNVPASCNLHRFLSPGKFGKGQKQ